MHKLKQLIRQLILPDGKDKNMKESVEQIGNLRANEQGREEYVRRILNVVG